MSFLSRADRILGRPAGCLCRVGRLLVRMLETVPTLTDSLLEVSATEKPARSRLMIEFSLSRVVFFIGAKWMDNRLKQVSFLYKNGSPYTELVEVMCERRRETRNEEEKMKDNKKQEFHMQVTKSFK